MGDTLPIYNSFSLVDAFFRLTIESAVTCKFGTFMGYHLNTVKSNVYALPQWRYQQDRKPSPPMDELPDTKCFLVMSLVNLAP
jgi:hypothetical protein